MKAAQAQNQLYSNQAWVELEKARLQLAAVQACATNPNCTIVVGVDGAIVTTK